MLFRQADVWETGVKMADVFYKILQMSISASWLILAIVVLRIFLKKGSKKDNMLSVGAGCDKTGVSVCD